MLTRIDHLPHQGGLTVRGVGLEDYIKKTVQGLMGDGGDWTGGGGDGGNTGGGGGGNPDSWYKGPDHCVSGFTEAYKGYCYKEFSAAKQSSSEYSVKVPDGLTAMRVVL